MALNTDAHRVQKIVICSERKIDGTAGSFATRTIIFEFDDGTTHEINAYTTTGEDDRSLTVEIR